MEPFHADWFRQHKYDSFCMQWQQCGAIVEQLNLFNKYLLLVTFETDDNYSIWFKISNSSSTIRFDSIRNEKTLFAHHCLLCCWMIFGPKTNSVSRWRLECYGEHRRDCREHSECVHQWKKKKHPRIRSWSCQTEMTLLCLKVKSKVRL